MKQIVLSLFLVLAVCLVSFSCLADGKVVATTFEAFQGAIFDDSCTEIEIAADITVTETIPLFKKVTIMEGVTLTIDSSEHPGSYVGLIVLEGSRLVINGNIVSKAAFQSSTSELNLQGGTIDATNGDLNGAQIQLTYRNGTADVNGVLILPTDPAKAATLTTMCGVVSEEQLIAANEMPECSEIIIEDSVTLTKDLSLAKFTIIVNDAVLTVSKGVSVTYTNNATIVCVMGSITGDGNWPK